jgi:hypothetical protein
VLTVGTHGSETKNTPTQSMKTIAIRIQDSNSTARRFGECAGDYSAGECRYWVGTVKALHPRANVPAGVPTIVAPVRYCGGDAWVQHDTRRGRAAAAMDAASRHARTWQIHGFGGMVASGRVARAGRFGRWNAEMTLGKIRAVPAPALP